MHLKKKEKTKNGPSEIPPQKKEIQVKNGKDSVLYANRPVDTAVDLLPSSSSPTKKKNAAEPSPPSGWLHTFAASCSSSISRPIRDLMRRRWPMEFMQLISIIVVVG